MASLVTRPKRRDALPPKHFDEPEKKLWTDLLDAFQIEDAASLSLLSTALEAHQRMRLAREQIKKDGMTIADRFGQAKPHPLLTVERDARTGYLTAMRVLNLDVGAGK